jgi:uncharacterized protein
MSQTYDALLDQLAALAVHAVQHVEMALHAYWLALSSTLWQEHSLVRLGTLLHTAQTGVTLPLAAWAMPYAPGALGSLLHQGVWYQSVVAGRLPHYQQHTWETLQHYAAVQLGCPPAPALYLPDVQQETRALWHAAERLYGPEAQIFTGIPREVVRGVVLFEAGLYFACHEYFELLWGRTDDTASNFYQGLIQVAVAMRHLESHNVRGAITLLHYGIRRFQPYPGMYKGLQLAVFVQRLHALLADLESLAEPTTYRFDAATIPPLVCAAGQGEKRAVCR